MNEPKPLASLSGSLLARKGAARPAMRPQVQRLAVEQLPEGAHLEDLGWNDMGDGPEPGRTAEPLHLTPSPVLPELREEAQADDRVANAQLAENARQISANTAVPEVVRQQELLVRKLAVPEQSPEPASAPARAARPRKPARDGGRRAAFTLRLDAERHLKLRLATTLEGRSAQQLVTRALDRLLEEMPELELLAAQMKRRGTDIAN